jgi:hypothetical protein
MCCILVIKLPNVLIHYQSIADPRFIRRKFTLPTAFTGANTLVYPTYKYAKSDLRLVSGRNSCSVTSGNRI